MNGKIIVIEGLDGSGKSTQLQLLEQRFITEKTEFKKIKLPDYDDPSSTLVKMYLAGNFGTDANAVNAYAASAFYAVDRYASYKRHWGADYLGGKLILADRYATSNFIYQMTKLPQNEWEAYISWAEDFEYNRFALPKPDSVIFLDMPVEISQKLLSKRYNGVESEKDVHECNIGFLSSCRQAALYAAKRLEYGRLYRAVTAKSPLRLKAYMNSFTAV